jgi:hypothetical protein
MTASMAQPKQTLCRYFANGACFRGNDCYYAHDFSKPSDQVCFQEILGGKYSHVTINLQAAYLLIGPLSLGLQILSEGKLRVWDWLPV